MLQRPVRGYVIPKGQRGFTLVELMYATGYFMLGLAGLVCFQMVASAGTQRAQAIMMASNLTASTLESLRVQSVSSVLNAPQPIVATYDQFGIPNGAPTYFTVTANATAVSGMPYYELAVTTSWVTSATNPFTHNISMQTRIPTE